MNASSPHSERRCNTLSLLHPTGTAYVLMFLPPYAPNLNLIERLWKYFKKNVLYNHYFETFDEFKQACTHFFDNLDEHHAPLRTLLTEKFQIIEGKVGYS